MKRSKDKKAIRAGMKFLADALDRLPDDEAAEIFNAVMAAYDEAAESQPSAEPAYSIAFPMGYAMSRPEAGRPSKESAPAPDLARLIANPAHRARIEAILQSGAIKKPANVAHLAQAIVELGWANRQAASLRYFFTFVAHKIGVSAGTYNTYKSTLARAGNTKPKANENGATRREIRIFIKLLQADEI